MVVDRQGTRPDTHGHQSTLCFNSEKGVHGVDLTVTIPYARVSVTNQGVAASSSHSTFGTERQTTLQLSFKVINPPSLYIFTPQFSYSTPCLIFSLPYLCKNFSSGSWRKTLQSFLFPADAPSC